MSVTNDGRRALNDGLTAGSKDEIDGLKSTRNPIQVLSTLSNSSTHNTFRDLSYIARDDVKSQILLPSLASNPRLFQPHCLSLRLFEVSLVHHLTKERRVVEDAVSYPSEWPG